MITLFKQYCCIVRVLPLRKKNRLLYNLGVRLTMQQLPVGFMLMLKESDFSIAITAGYHDYIQATYDQ